MNDLERLAAERTALHAGQASQTILCRDHELMGLAGEQALCDEFGGKIDRTPRPYGDNGVDLVIKLRIGEEVKPYIVDVKCTRSPYRMLVKEGTVKAHIYVLAEYFDHTKTAKLVGWQSRKVVLKWAAYDTGRGIINHNVPNAPIPDGLRPIWQLKERLA
jgi:hypothetical protein